MEASEAVRRIFWRHRWLLLILMIVPAAAVVPLKMHQPVTYAATATVQGQGTTPDADTQVQAIQSRVTAVAKDPNLVQNAISEARVSRDATQVARHEISVAPMGSSAIMVLTVTDPSPQVAMALSKSLADWIVYQLNQLGIKDNPELAALSKTSSQLATRRNQLLSQLSSTNASNAATSVPVQSLLSQLGAVEQQQATNESQTQQILATLTAETGASVVSVPTYATGVSRHVAVDAILAALLGLVLGLLFATLREVIRPTVGQPGAGARELGAVLLGGADVHRDRIVRIDQDLPERLNLAAHRAGVLTIVLTGPGPQDRLAALAARLREELPPPERGRRAQRLGAGHRPARSRPPRRRRGHQRRRTPPGRHRRRAPPRRPGYRPADRHQRRPRPQKQQRTVVTLNDIRLGAPPPDAALVVVLPRFAPHAALDQAADLGVTADWPILGVIGIRRLGWLATLRKRPAAPSEARVLASRLPDARATEVRDPDTMPAFAGTG